MVIKSGKKAAHILKHSLVHLALIVICVFTLLPIAYTISVAFSPTNTLISSSFSLIPRGATFQNFAAVLRMKNFSTWALNSVFLSLATVLFALSVCIPASYAYSRWKFPGKKKSLFVLLVLNAFPAILSMAAIYKIFRTLGLLNSYRGLILVYSGSMIVFALWNLKGYFDTIPVAIEEAAMIDGAGYFQIVRLIIIPLSMPAIIVTAMLVFITTWNEYIYAVTFLRDPEKLTLAAGLYSLQATQFTRNWPLFAAGSLVVTVPVLVVFFIVQRFMASGLTAGGTKY